MSILFYKKPEFSNKEGALSESSCQRYVERAAGSRAAIPDELSFKNILEERTLPPCSLQDFLDYLVYVSHDAENLQFYLWYKDYCKRFNTAPGWKKELSPLWSERANQPRKNPKITTTTVPLSRYASNTSPLPSPLPKLDKNLPSAPTPAQQFKDFSFKPHQEPILSSPRSEHSSDTASLAADVAEEMTRPSVDEKTRTRQPFREEVERIADHYLKVGSPRELNLSGKERECVLRAVEQTTHPTAFLEVATLIETTLRYHSHRNFVRWSICNGNKPRVFVLRSIAIFVLSCTLALAFVLILSNYSRWYRLSVIPLCYFASVNLIAARQGLCVLLHRRKTREARPWEIGDPNAGDMMRSNTSRDLEQGADIRNMNEKRAHFGGKNEYRQEPWVRRWATRSTWQRIRVQKIKIGPGGLRNIQDRILWQAEAWGLLVTIVFTAAVCAFPVFGLY